MRGRQRKGSESWCPRAAIRTAMPPAAAMAILLSSLHARFANAPQALLRTATFFGSLFITTSVACRGNDVWVRMA